MRLTGCNDFTSRCVHRNKNVIFYSRKKTCLLQFAFLGLQTCHNTNVIFKRQTKSLILLQGWKLWQRSNSASRFFSSLLDLPSPFCHTFCLKETFLILAATNCPPMRDVLFKRCHSKKISIWVLLWWETSNIVQR